MTVHRGWTANPVSGQPDRHDCACSAVPVFFSTSCGLMSKLKRKSDKPKHGYLNGYLNCRIGHQFDYWQRDIPIRTTVIL